VISINVGVRMLHDDLIMSGAWATALQAVAGSIPNGVTGIFHWHNPSGCTMTLGLTQPLTAMSTRNIFWG